MKVINLSEELVVHVQAAVVWVSSFAGKLMRNLKYINNLLYIMYITIKVVDTQKTNVAETWPQSTCMLFHVKEF